MDKAVLTGGPHRCSFGVAGSCHTSTGPRGRGLRFGLDASHGRRRFLAGSPDCCRGDGDGHGEFFTPTVYIAVLSFLAYVIGMLMMVDIKQGSTIRLGSRLRLPYVSKTDRAVVEGHVEAALHRARIRAADGYKIQREFRLEPMLTTEEAYNDFRIDHQEDERSMNEEWRKYALRQLKEPMVEEIIKSIPSLAIKLQDKNAVL